MTDIQGLMDYAGAAAYLAITPRQVRELWARRELTAVKLGRLVRFRQQDLDEYAARNLVRAVR